MRTEAPRLWDVQLHLSVHRVDLLAHRQRSGVQIQVGPLEGHQLPAAKAGAQVQQEQFKGSVRLGLEEKPPELPGREHLHLPAPPGRQLAARGRVGPDQVLLHRLVQRRTALGVAHPHHPVGEARAVELRPDQPPLFFQVGVELLEVLLCQLAQRDLSQLRDDMQVDGTFIGALRGGAEAGLDVVLIPEVHPLTEGHVGADLLRSCAAHFLQELGELFLALVLGLGQHVFSLGAGPCRHSPPRPGLPSGRLCAALRCRFRFCVFLPRSQLLSQQIFQEAAHHVAGGPLHVRRHVGVGVQGEGRVGVTQDAGERLGVHAAGEGVGGEGVTQVVEPDVGQPASFSSSFIQ